MALRRHGTRFIFDHDDLVPELPCVLASGDEIGARFGAAGFAQLVAPRDVQGTADAVLRLIENHAARRQARVAAVALAEECRWSSVVQPPAATLEELAEARPRARSMSRALVRAVGGTPGG